MSFVQRFASLHPLLWGNRVHEARTEFHRMLHDAQAASDPEGVFLALEGLRLAAIQLGDAALARQFAVEQAELRPTTANWLLIASTDAVDGDLNGAESAANRARREATTQDEIEAAEDVIARIAKKRSGDGA